MRGFSIENRLGPFENRLVDRLFPRKLRKPLAFAAWFSLLGMAPREKQIVGWWADVPPR
jgi:hypothetical protein